MFDTRVNMAYCDLCDRYFGSYAALNQHKANSAQHNVYCETCDRHFGSYAALNQHKVDSSQHNICDDCDLDFATWDDLQEHYIEDDDHFYCEDCDEHFSDDDDLEDHYEEAHWRCHSCSRIFKNELGLKDHYRQSSQHHYCAQCDRHFQGESQLRNRHHPRDVPCRGKGCTQTFISVSAMLLHLEAGTCVSGATRRLVNTKVRELDRNNIITDPSRMLTSSQHNNTTYYASSVAWNGAAWECYLCHGTFRSLAALNQHLASPRHQDKIYLCPATQCRIKFTTLSALCQHIESEKCGVHKFKQVKLTMDVIVGQMGRLKM
ncbi:hypothetical protein DXG01_002746 [Tephrocybe rancida]|nr:hypothetical protein DXG01_002746 [Tephrocybe rancida]